MDGSKLLAFLFLEVVKQVVVFILETNKVVLNFI